MNKYVVYGTVTVSVEKEIWANNEDEAIQKAYERLTSLTEYCGNGGYDKLVGVDGEDERVSADGDIEWNSTDLLESDPDYHECPECGEQLNKDEYGWYCIDCEKWFNEDGEEIFPEDEEEEE